MTHQQKKIKQRNTSIRKRNDFPVQKPDQGHNEDEEPILPPIHLNRKSIITANNNSNHGKSKNKKNSNAWMVQLTEDGEGQYLFNPTTGEMRFMFSEDDGDNNERQYNSNDGVGYVDHNYNDKNVLDNDDDDNSSFLDASDRSWLHEYEEDEGGRRIMEEEVEFVPQKVKIFIVLHL